MLKKHHIDKVPVSDLCNEAELQPSVFYHWQRHLFENAAGVFDAAKKGAASGREKALEARVAELALLAERGGSRGSR